MAGRLLQTPSQLFAAAAACAAGFVGVLVVAYGSEPAARADALALRDFGRALREPVTARVAEDVAQLVDPRPFAVLSALVVVVALVRRGVGHAAAIAVLLVGANVTTQVLKPLLASPRGTLGGWVLGPEAFPSGHSTAAMSLALAAVVVAPPVIRPLVALAGAALAVAVGFSLVAIDAHFPSDVAGGYLVAGGWLFASLAALRRFEGARRDEGEPALRGQRRAVAVLLAAFAAACVIGAAELPALVDHARGHTAFAVVAAGTAALGAVIVAAAAVAAGPPARRPYRGGSPSSVESPSA